MTAYLDILVLLIVAVLIFQRLRSVLGTNPTEEKRIRLSKENAEKLYNILKNEADRMSAAEKTQMQQTEELTPINEEELNDTEKALRKIPDFKKDKFINNAKRAFEIITTAFNNADIETLEILVSSKLLKKFQEIIEIRKNKNICAETDFIGFNKVEILNAEIKANKNAIIMVEFVSEQVNILRDAEGNVIEGDENYIQNITDVWTFERNILSTSPNWVLVSTKKQ